MIKKIMFDTNAFDRLLSIEIDWSAFEKKSRNKYEYYITPIQIEELENICDDSREKRIRLALLRTHIQLKMVPAIATVDHARLGECVLADENDSDIYDRLKNQNEKNSNDANIGTVAHREGCIIVTEDRDFIKRLKENKQDVWTFDEWWTEFMSG